MSVLNDLVKLTANASETSDKSISPMRAHSTGLPSELLSSALMVYGLFCTFGLSSLKNCREELNHVGELLLGFIEKTSGDDTGSARLWQVTTRV